MGRPPVTIDEEKLMDMLGRGIPRGDMAQSLGVSAPTLRNKIAELKAKEGDLLEYRDLDHRRVTELRGKLLAKLEEKIDTGSLETDEQIALLNILDRSEAKNKPKEGDVEGLMGHLLEAQKAIQEEKAKLKEQNRPEEAEPAKAEIIDVEAKEVIDE